MNMKITTYCCLIVIVTTVFGCNGKVITENEAITLARGEMINTAKLDGIDVSSVQLINVRENTEINGWEVYFENPSRKYRLNILVVRDGGIEVHKLKQINGGRLD